jgi:hypothetical protein
MLDWFVILTPLLVLAVVALLGFIGCNSVLGLQDANLRIFLNKLDPNIGASAGGTMVTLTGSNMTGATKVTFGGADALFKVVSDSEIDAISPPNPVGPAGVIVSSAVVDSQFPVTFTYVAIGFVQMQANSASAGTSIQVTLNNPTTAGNLLIAAVSYQGAGLVTVKDNLGNAFNSTGKHGWFQGQAEMFYLPGTGGGSVTVTATGGTAPWNICVSEYSGGASLGPVSGNNSPNTGSVPEDMSGVAVMPATGNAVYVVAFGVQGSNANFAAGVGFAGHSSPQDSAVLAEDTMSPVTGAEVVAVASPASFVPWVVLASEIQV